MSETRHTHRRTRTVALAVVCALLTCALAGASPAGASQESLLAGARAQERYYQSFGGSGATVPSQLAAAHAQERYYASYGEPRPIAVAHSPAPSDGAPWLPITLAVAAAMAIVAAAVSAVRRLHLRRATRVAL
jgi:hypothetical protein